MALLRESAPWSRGELEVPLKETWWVPSESGAARGGRGRAELAGRVARECQSASESERHAAIQVSNPAGMGVPHRVEGQEAPGPAPGPWVTPQLRLVVT